MNSDKVSSLAKVTKRQLDTWVTRGWLKPLSVPGIGRGGMERDWPSAEVEKARLMGHLVQSGILPHVAHKIATGDRAFIAKLLGAVAMCMPKGELTYRWFGSDPVGDNRAVAGMGPCASCGHVQHQHTDAGCGQCTLCPGWVQCA